jgi:hypothetical protein
MKKVVILIFIFSLTAGMVISQEMNMKVTDPKTGKPVLSGYCDKKGLKEGEFGEVFQQYYKSYDPDQEVIKKIKSLKKDVEILVVLGTWCHDSKEQVPRFFKVVDKVWLLPKKVEIICVNTLKEAEGVDISPYDIKRVPTFIFMKDGMEIGRIIETPAKSIEEDMLMILGG